MKILCYVLVAMLVLCGTGCVRNPETRVEMSASVCSTGTPSVLVNRPETMIAREALMSDQISTNVFDAYRNAPYHEFFARVEQVSTGSSDVARDGPYYVLVHMAKHRLKILATDQKRGLIVGVSLLDGIHSELWPKDPVGLFTTPSEHPQGRGDILKKENDDVECVGCMIGSYLVSWVGDPGSVDATGFIDLPQIFQNMIRGGKRLPDASQFGRDCYVFQQVIDVSEVGGPPEHISHVIYVDKGTYFVLRWETTQPPGIQRTREFEIVDSKRPLRDMNWNVSRENDAGMRIIPWIRD